MYHDWQFKRLQSGLAVSDISGVRMGTVGVVRENDWQLATLTGETLWVKPEALFKVRDGVTLICNASGIGQMCTE